MDTSSYILTLDLKPQMFQEYILEKRFNITRQIYNACINYILKQHKIMTCNKEYIENLSIPKSKERNNKFKQLSLKYNLTEYQLHKFVKSIQHHFKENIDSFTAQKIATKSFQAYQKLIFGNGKQLHFKKYGEFNSIEGKSNSTGIRYANNYLIWNKLIIPVLIDKNDIYAQIALQDRIKYCRILRKLIRGKIKYYLQLTLEGIPPQKINKEIRNNGEVGLDIGISTLAIVSDNKVSLVEFCSDLENIDNERRMLQRKLDRQRRANNPNKYNENGTIKTKNKDRWVFSNGYIKTKNKLNDIQRKLAAKRKTEHEILANIVLEKGNNIKAENMNYIGLQKGKFDKAVDTEGLAADVKEAAENGANYREVPHGVYEVEVNKLELIESKKGDPMVTIWFKVVDGEYKGCLIFMNQVVNQGFQIHIVNEILRQMTAELPDFNIEFKTYRQYGELLMDVREAIDGKFEFKLDYAEGKKGFSTYSIDEIYILE